MTTTLDALKQYTTVVADTSDFRLLTQYQPRDATTNPSLILQAVSQADYRGLLQQARQAAHRHPSIDEIIDHLLVLLGCEILAMIPGRVSTEVDARLSFNTAATVAKAQTLIARYQALGIARERVLIKIASTWEGIRAAEILARAGIHCNMTLIFSLTQAAASADAGVRLISPFVGRVDDWYREKAGAIRNEPPPSSANTNTNTNHHSPGVALVRRIYAYCKQWGYATEVMGASFRTMAQVLELAGCDLLTISPALLNQLQQSTQAVERKLSPEKGRGQNEMTERLILDEPLFRYQLNEDAMATEKLAEGIRRFAADTIKLERLIQAQS